MALQSSGAISLSELATEFSDTTPNSMSEFYRNGSLVPSNNTDVPTAGEVNLSDYYDAVNEISVTATSTTNVNLATAFGSDWTTNIPKRYVVPSGVTVGGTGGTAAITVPSNISGTLIIEVTGSVIGTGGAASGGNGGHAVSNSASGVTLVVNNNGLVAGGGGGGGDGGAGGNGSYSQDSGQVYSSSNHVSDATDPQYYRWGGTNFKFTNASSFYWPGTSAPLGAATFYKGSKYTTNPDGINYYRIRRVATVTTTGGAGGAGGVGQGYNQTNTSGSAGATGGTNSGAGGTGGAGNTYGLAGGTGGTGANGNSTNGQAGSAGGTAGDAVNGTALSTYTNNGTVHGSVST